MLCKGKKARCVLLGWRHLEEMILIKSQPFAGAKTGRSPRDKRVVRDPASEKDIWWAAPDGQQSNGAPNYEMDERWAAPVLDPHCYNSWQDEGHLGGPTFLVRRAGCLYRI